MPLTYRGQRIGKHKGAACNPEERKGDLVSGGSQAASRWRGNEGSGEGKRSSVVKKQGFKTPNARANQGARQYKIIRNIRRYRLQRQRGGSRKRAAEPRQIIREVWRTGSKKSRGCVCLYQREKEGERERGCTDENRERERERRTTGGGPADSPSSHRQGGGEPIAGRGE